MEAKFKINDTIIFGSKQFKVVDVKLKTFKAHKYEKWEDGIKNIIEVLEETTYLYKIKLIQDEPAIPVVYSSVRESQLLIVA